MKKITLTLASILLMSAAFAKAPISEDLQREVLKLDRTENAAYVQLQQAEQNALMGEISSEELAAIRQKYNAAKKALEDEISNLGNRPEVEKWLIDNHVRVEQ